MKQFILTSESTLDLPYSYVNEREIDVLFYKYNVNGVDYVDDMVRNPNALKEFYERIDLDMPTTSQANLADYLEFFEGIIEKAKGKDILHLVFGTGMTQSYNNAVLAKNILAEKYPNQRLELIDSLCSSAGFGMLVDSVADLRDQGKSFEEAIEWTLQNRLKVNHQIYTTTLDYLKRGGRVSGASAAIGSMLKICPLMKLDNEGKIIAYAKARGKKKAMLETVKAMIDLAEGSTNYDGKCFISHANCIEDANDLKSELEKNFPNLEGKIRIFDIGTIIASHTGPGTVALFFMGADRTPN